ncbi:MAG: lipocalin family protein [Victivallaceae bacterium]|nr:lipocalin family protein [Victivallaceae bacterium]
METTKKAKHFLTLLASASVLWLGSGCGGAAGTGDIPAVTGFDAEKYLGVWHEAARLPQWFERDTTGVTATYTKLDDGRIKVVNRGRRHGEAVSAEAVAVFRDTPDIGWLRVSFFRPFYGDYKIILLAPDYSSAVVTSDDRDSLWILSRTPELPPEIMAGYLEKTAAWGFDNSKLEFPVASTGAAANADAGASADSL